MRTRLLGLGLGLTLTVAGVMVPAATASADSTCYTGCTPTTEPGGPAPAEPVAAKVSSSELAFTGADIEEMTAIGAGALIVGGVLLRRNRRRHGVSA
jgi:hypothetical protein